MVKRLYLAGNSTHVDVSVQDDSVSGSPTQLDRDDVTKIVDILLGLNPSSSDRLAKGSRTFALTDTDRAWLTAILFLAFDNRSSRIRRRAIQALAAIAGPKALQALKRALQDEDESVRWIAKGSIAQLTRSSKGCSNNAIG